MKIFLQILGILLILAGLPLFWTPVPVGAFLILIGIALVVANSQSAQNWLRDSRSKHGWLDRWMAKTEKFTPRPITRILRRTHPDQ